MFSKLLELEPDNERDQARLYQYRDFILAIWEDPVIQVSSVVLWLSKCSGFDFKGLSSKS